MKFFHKAIQEKLFAINYEMEKNLFIRPFVVSEEWQTFINFEIGSFDLMVNMCTGIMFLTMLW